MVSFGDGVQASDAEASARKKAQMAASAELAAILAKTVESTTEEYSTILSEGMSSESKSLLTDKTKITVNQTLAGATDCIRPLGQRRENRTIY